VNAHGETIRKAFNKVYRMIDGLHIPDGQWRNDISEVCEEDCEKLEAMVTA
jgi:hypothetical protein